MYKNCTQKKQINRNKKFYGNKQLKINKQKWKEFFGIEPKRSIRID